MGHLGDSTPITTVQDKEIVLTGSNGQTFKMKVADLAEAVRQVMPVATSKKDGLMSTSFYKSIYHIRAVIGPRGVFDTEILTGGLILFQNSSMVHDISVAIMYSDGRGKVISTAPHVSFFGGSDSLDVRKESLTKSIEIVNNTDATRTFHFRIICSSI